MKKRVKIIINEQHSLLPDQDRVLRKKFNDHNLEFVKVPASGWTIEEMKQKINELSQADVVVFVSPVPYILAMMSFDRGYDQGFGLAGGQFPDQASEVFIFMNEHREKKELPDGRMIQVLAPIGWKLVQIGI